MNATDATVIATLESTDVLLPIAEVTGVQWRDADANPLGYLWLATARGKITVQFLPDQSGEVRAVFDFLRSQGIAERADVLGMPDRRPVSESISKAATQAGSWLSKQLGTASSWLDQKTSGSGSAPGPTPPTGPPPDAGPPPTAPRP